MRAVAAMLAELRERVVHRESMWETLRRELAHCSGAELVTLRRELHAMLSDVEHALVEESRSPRAVSVRSRPLRSSHCWHTCECRSCCDARRRFESQHEGGRG